jgi:hypothetical protein
VGAILVEGPNTFLEENHPMTISSKFLKKNLFTTLHLLEKITKIRLILRSSYGKGKQTILNLRPICQLYGQPSYMQALPKRSILLLVTVEEIK